MSKSLRFPQELLEFSTTQQQLRRSSHRCTLLIVFTCVGVHVSGTHPSVVMVTIVYQKEAGILVNLLELDPFSA